MSFRWNRSSSSMSNPHTNHPLSHIYDQGTEDSNDDEDEDEKIECEETTNDHNNNINNTSMQSQSSSRTNIVSRSMTQPHSHVSSGWMTVQQFMNDTDFSSQREQAKLFMSLLRDIFKELTPQTQICIVLLSIGLFLIFISLPTSVIIGTLLLCTGLSGIGNIAANKCITFAREKGLISLLKSGIMKNFILEGSIVDIFWEIRNSRLGIPDFLLSQILPLDEPERELIFEKLPDITRDFVSTEGLIYLLPQVIQNIVLPTHLQRNYASLDIGQDLSQLSPITESPSQQSQEFDDIRHVFINERPTGSPLSMSQDDDFVIDDDDDTNNNNIDSRENRDDTDDSLRGRVRYDDTTPIVSTIAKTKDEFESFGKNLLFRGKRMESDGNNNDDDKEEEEDKKNEENDGDGNKNKKNKNKNKVTTYVLQSNQNNPDQTQVFESTSDSSSSLNHSNQLLKYNDDDDNNIHDGDLSDIVRNDNNNKNNKINNLLILTPKNKLTRSISNPLQIDNYPNDGMQELDEEEIITTDDSDVEEEMIENNGDNKIENSSWIRHVGQLFSEKMLGKRGDLPTKPIVAAVIDTRMKELALQMISYIWKSPFSKISDSQLIAIFITSICIIGIYLTRNKNIRQKFIKSLKYMSIMALFWIALFCFIELNIRRKSKLFKKIIDYINKQLFYSEHHKSLQKAKKSHSDLKKASMSVYVDKVSSKRDLLANMSAGRGINGRGRKSSSKRSSSRKDLLKKTKSVSLRRIDMDDRKSKSSKTLGYIDFRQRMKNKTKLNQSIRSQDRGNLMYSLPLTPKSNGGISISSGSSLSESPWNTPKRNPILSNRRRTTSSLLIPSNYNHDNKMARKSAPYT